MSASLEGMFIMLNSGDKAGSDLDINLPIVQSGKAVQGQVRCQCIPANGLSECYGSSTVDALAVKDKEPLILN